MHAPSSISGENAQVEALARRVTRLYSLPAVAMEVVQLSERPEVDVQALRECLERDPALTAKVLRVVNSSLFGLSHQVANLHQAVALLGTSPLKLLVLGFSLPPDLLANATKEQLQWYWTSSLTRAVAARKLSQRLWNEAGDEAFLAGLLQDIGLLTLLQELNSSFARFLDRVIAEQRDVLAAEREALGFDHRQLSGALLRDWKLPERLTEAISTVQPPRRLARLTSPGAELAKVLHLAELLAQLVSQRRIRVLPDLLEFGTLYRGLNKNVLHELVAELQPQVDQLAEILSLDLPGGRSYAEVLIEAHAHMSQLAEAKFVLRQPVRVPEAADLLAESAELTSAMKKFLQTESARPAPERTVVQEQSATEQMHTGELSLGSLHEAITSAARSCRVRRAEFSLLLLEIEEADSLTSHEAEEIARLVPRVVRQTCLELHHESLCLQPLPENQWAVVVSSCDRCQGVRLANTIVNHVMQWAIEEHTCRAEISLKVAVATVVSVLRNFAADDLLEGAQRCLSAARLHGGNAIKSIEVY